MLIISLILLQILIFAGLIFMLKRMFVRNVVSATKHLDELNQDYVKKEEEASRQLEEAKQKAQEIVSKATDEAENLKGRIIKESNDEGDAIVKEARAKSDDIIQQADKTRQRLLSEVDERVAKEAIDRACELIQHALPEQLKQDAHSQGVEELIASGFTKLERLRIPPDIREIKIISAFKLNETQRKSLSKKLKDALGHEAVLKEEVDPAMVAGIVINIGSLVLDGSLKNKIQEQAKNVKHAANE